MGQELYKFRPLLSLVEHTLPFHWRLSLTGLQTLYLNKVSPLLQPRLGTLAGIGLVAVTLH